MFCFLPMLAMQSRVARLTTRRHARVKIFPLHFQEALMVYCLQNLGNTAVLRNYVSARADIFPSALHGRVLQASLRCDTRV